MININRPVIQKFSIKRGVSVLAYIVMFILCCFWVNNTTAQEKELTTLTPVFAIQRAGDLMIKKLKDDKVNLQIGGRQFHSGIRTNVSSEITYVFDTDYNQLDTWVGLASTHSNSTSKDNNDTVIFKIFGDGNKIYDSGILDAKTPAKHVVVNIDGMKELTLFAGASGHSNHAAVIWGDPLLSLDRTVETHGASTPVYEIKGGDHTSIKLDHDGHIAAINIGGNNRFLPLQGKTKLAQCHEAKLIKVQHLKGGGMTFTHLVSNQTGDTCFVTDNYIPTKNSVRWDVDIYSTGDSWSTDVITSIKWPVTKETRFWTSWARPDLLNQQDLKNNATLNDLNRKWEDPLIARPFTNSARWYGGTPIRIPSAYGDVFSVPIATVMDPRDSYGFSLAESPEDTVFYMKLITTKNGVIEFQHLHNRLGAGRHVRFSMDLVNHAKSWRSGLKWMVDRYPAYFNPVNSLAYKLSGCGAYSSWKGPLDTAKLKEMAFKFNWEASFDFPYMGMFMPPVERWHALAGPKESTIDSRPTTGNYKGMPMSKKLLEDYCRRMSNYGFYVLNYFNTTEFGMDVKSAEYARENIKEIKKENLWKNSTDFLYANIADGILLNQNGNYYRTWGNAIVMDPGAKDYQNFLINQAKQLIKYQPSSAGICIDRLDWLRFFNNRAESGKIAWYNNEPVRSLFTSWNSLMKRLGPLMHKNGKVIFVNPLVTMRLSIMQGIDGIYCEENELGPGLNASAFLGLRRPVAAWTHSIHNLEPDPNFYFQRFLYMGVFPTAPLPYNNHSVLPGKFTDKWYLEYGPLFRAMEGRKWVLIPHAVTVPKGNAKANVFKAPSGYVVPVVLADTGITKTKVLLNAQLFAASPLSTYTIDIIQPGVEKPILLKTVKDNTNNVVFEVPLRQGCALVRFRHKQ